MNNSLSYNNMVASIDMLSAPHKHILQMRYVQNLSVNEIAGKLGTPFEGASRAILRAFAVLNDAEFGSTTLKGNNVNESNSCGALPGM